MSPELPDEELVALSKMRNMRSGKAYGFLVVRHEPWVLRMLKNLLRTPEAEEVKQDSFFTGWKQIHKLLENTHFRGWIRSIAVNTAYKRHRRQMLEQKEQEERELATDSDVFCDHVEAQEAVRGVHLGLEIQLIRQLLLVVFGTGGLALALGLGFGAHRVIRNLLSRAYVEQALPIGSRVVIEGIELGILKAFAAQSVVFEDEEGRETWVPYIDFITNKFLVLGIGIPSVDP